MSNKVSLKKVKKDLAPYYNDGDNNIIDLNKFIKVEILLFLFHKVAPGEDVSGAYILLSGLNIIGRDNFNYDDYLMFNAKKILKELRSKKVWEDWLESYKKIRKSIRLFKFMEKNTIGFNGDEEYFDRRKAYKAILEVYSEESKDSIKLAKAHEEYYFCYDDFCEKVIFPELKSLKDNIKVRKKKGGSISISIAELIEAAKEMDIISASNNERKNRADFLKNAVFKKNHNGDVHKTADLTIKQVCNMVGMVGSGKSTVMEVISYWAAKNGFRLVIVLDSVAEVMKSVKLFEKLGIDVVPLLGKYNREEQLDKIVETGEMYLPPEYAKHLTAICPLDGLRRRTGDKPLNYGKEPCLNLGKKIKGKIEKTNYICPLYYNCPSKARDIGLATAGIVVTTPAGLIYGRTPFPVLKKKKRFVEYLIDDFDLVIFDEADRVQSNFDAAFCPNSSIDELISRNSPLIKEYMDAQGRRLDMDRDERKFNNELMKLPQICDAVKELINNNKAVSDWERIGEGKSFSALVLLQEDEEIPENLKQDLLMLIEKDTPTKGLEQIMLRIYENADDPENGLMINQWVKQYEEGVKQYEEVSDIFKLRIRFIIYLIALEKRLRYVSDYGISVEFNHNKQIEGFLRNRFHQLQRYLPASAVGNIFGFIYDNKNKIVKTFRQFAFGRALMLCLPYLKISKSWKPEGPNVLFLSATGWAKGAAKYHVWADVNYIIESNKEVRQRIKDSKVIKIPSDVRVSGSNERQNSLKELVRRSESYIRNELEDKPDGRILFIVNSYPETKDTKYYLSEIFSSKSVAYMVKDDYDGDEEDAIKRRDIWGFYKTNNRMLVAPAGAMDRGHNIVDDEGHSILTSLFFLTRPMSVPDDIEESIIRLNGMVVERVENMTKGGYDYMKNMRAFAVRRWKAMLGNNHRAIENLKEYDKLDITVSRLVIIHQIFGRLARIIDLEKPVPSIYFADAAFEAGKESSFDLLNEMMVWLKKQIEEGEDRIIAKTLYEPFYIACERGLGLND